LTYYLAADEQNDKHPLRRTKRKLEFRIGGMPLKEKIRYGRYLDVGLREAEKLADPNRLIFFRLYCDALDGEDQTVDLPSLRRRAAELAAEATTPEPEAEPPVEVAPREPIIISEASDANCGGDGYEPGEARAPPVKNKIAASNEGDAA
jgi:hypothetical protein